MQDLLIKQITVASATVLLYSRDGGVTWFSNPRDGAAYEEQRRRKMKKLKSEWKQVYIPRWDR